jgi:hypothetical protein
MRVSREWLLAINQVVNDAVADIILSLFGLIVGLPIIGATFPDWPA